MQLHLHLQESRDFRVATALPKLELEMSTTMFRARYTDEKTLKQELFNLFPTDNVQITYQRGRYSCKTPRPLSPEEIDQIKLVLKQDAHYNSAEGTGA